MRAAKAAKGFQEFAAGLAQHLGECISIELAEKSGTYLMQTVSPTIAPMIAALCNQKPDNVEEFALMWMAEHLALAEALIKQLRVSFTGLDADCTAAAAEGNEPEAVGLHIHRLSPEVPECIENSDNVQHCRLSSAADSSAIPRRPAGLAPPKRFVRRRSSSGLQFMPALTGNDAPEGSNLTVGESSSIQQPEGAVARVVRKASRSPTVHGRNLSLPSSGELSVKCRDERRTISYDFSEQPAAHEKGRRATVSFDASLPLPPKDQVVDMLQKVPMFSKYTLEDLGRVADIAVLQTHAVGDVITFAGAVASGLHMLHSGSGRVFQLYDAGTIGPGTHFGEQSLQVIGGGLSPVQVVVDTVAACITIPREEFGALQLRQRMERRAKMLRAGTASNGYGAVADKEDPADLDPIVGIRVRPKHQLVLDYEKTQADRDMIMQAVSANVALGEVMSLNAEQCSLFADTVSLVDVPSGVEVFKKGEQGDAFYVVKEGLLTVNVSENRVVKLRLGDSFGELALMYDETRSATVTAVVDCRLWVMSRQVFKRNCREMAERSTPGLARTLQKVPGIAALNVECSVLAFFLEETYFTVVGDEVCTEGFDDGMLFIVQEGQCCFLEEEDQVLGPGDWYGEVQLLQGVPAFKTMVVSSAPARILSLDEASLRLAIEVCSQMGDLTDIHSSLSNMGNYCRNSLLQQRAEIRQGLARCTVRGPLGEGAFGTVLYVEDSESQQSYAVKVLNIERLREQKQLNMVKNERDLMQVMDHPFIVRFYHAYRNDEFVYFMMEAVLGGELFDLYTEKELWGKADLARFYMASVSLGLEHLHSQRVVWRDLKLENCLVDSEGYLKLTDFGIAKMVVGLTYTVCGTADYFAPEVLKQQGYNRGADWWACGVLLFIMMAGRSPFDAPVVHQIYKNIVKGMTKATFPTGCPNAAEQLVRALCTKNPEERITMRKGGLSNLKNIDFFEQFSWDCLRQKSMAPPFAPQAVDIGAITSKKIQRKVDTDFTDLEVWDDGPLRLEEDACAKEAPGVSGRS